MRLFSDTPSSFEKCAWQQLFQECESTKSNRAEIAERLNNSYLEIEIVYDRTDLLSSEDYSPVNTLNYAQ